MIGAVILAAGAAVRFGSPKQLLVHKGQSLVRAAAKAATAAHTSPVIVVLGANRAQVAAELTRLRGVRTVVNEHWATGLASSLAVGLRALMEISGCDAALVMLADQPGVDAAALKEIDYGIRRRSSDRCSGLCRDCRRARDFWLRAHQGIDAHHRGQGRGSMASRSPRSSHHPCRFLKQSSTSIQRSTRNSSDECDRNRC